MKSFFFSANHLCVTPEFPIFSPLSLQPSCLSGTLHPHILFVFTERLTFCSSPEGLLSNSSVLQSLSPSLAIVVIVPSLTFCSCSCLRHHPGTLIYKLAAKAQPPPPSFHLLLGWRQSIEEIAELRGRKKEKGESLARIWFASQKKMTQRFWMSASGWHEFAYLCLEQAGKLVYLFQ